MLQTINSCKNHPNKIICSFCTFKDHKTPLCRDCLSQHTSHSSSIIRIPIFFLEDCSRFEYIGSGSFGKVFKVVLRANGEIKAAKVISLNEDDDEEINNEIEISCQMEHENLIKVEKVLRERIENDGTTDIILLMPFCEYDLKAFSNIQSHSLTPLLKKKIMIEIARGIEFLHNFSETKVIIHRDLKPQNILIFEKNKDDYAVKIGDFGISKILDKDNTKYTHTNIGTPIYMSPEVLKNEKYDRKCDIWACGIIFYEIAFGHHPFKNPTKSESKEIIKTRILENDQTFFDKRLNSCCLNEIISNCLEYSIENRIDSKQLLNSLEKMNINEDFPIIEIKREENKNQKNQKGIETTILRKSPIKMKSNKNDEILIKLPNEELLTIKSNQTSDFNKLGNQDEKKIQRVKIEQDELEDQSYGKIVKYSINFNKILDFLPNCSNIKELIINISQFTYNKDLIIKMMINISNLKDLLRLDLSLNNEYFLIQKNMHFNEKMLCGCLFLCIPWICILYQKYKTRYRKPFFYINHKEFQNKLELDGYDLKDMIDNNLFLVICSYITKCNKLQELNLSFGFNLISKNSLINGLKRLENSFKNLNSLKINARPQFTSLFIQNTEVLLDNLTFEMSEHKEIREILQRMCFQVQSDI